MNYDDGDSGLRRLTDTQRLRLMIALETEGEVTNEALLPAGLTPRLVAAVAGEASESAAQETPPVVEPDRHSNVPGAQAAVAV